MIETITYINTALLLGILLLLARQKMPTATRANTPASKHKIILDSCALIDGRVVDLVKAGFVSANIIVPEFIIAELQLLADGKDSQKRERARFGLDVVKTLQEIGKPPVDIDKTPVKSAKTDDKLVELAQKISGQLYTTDYNLNKVASIGGVEVLNVNELALSLRPVALPGETKKVKIIQRGSGRDQGVGYLDDGTMVVVDRASKLMQKIVEVEITRIHQSQSGKMMFADLKQRKS